MKRALALSYFTCLLLTTEAFSQVTISYDAIITTSIGAHAGQFPVGERVVISYTLNESATDVDPAPDFGSYDNAVLSMWVSFPGLDRFIHAGAQTTPFEAAAFVSNDAVSIGGESISDVVYLLGGEVTSSGPLDDDTITRMELEFGDFVTAPGLPPMITSDALPLVNMSSPYSYLHIAAGGHTTLRFVPTSPIRVSYDAIVTEASGPNAALFPAGERIQLTYTLSRNAIDREAAPERGSYDNTVLSFDVSFPGLGIFVNTGPPRYPFEGQFFAINDYPTSPPGALTDQVSIWAGWISAQSGLGGDPMTNVVGGFHDFPPVGAIPQMLADDSVPEHKLRADPSYVLLRTAGTTTTVEFELAPMEKINLLIADVNAVVTSGGLPADRAERLLRSLESAASSIERDNTGSACSHLRSFVRRVEDEVAGGVLTPAAGQVLIDRAVELQEQLGC